MPYALQTHSQRSGRQRIADRQRKKDDPLQAFYKTARWRRLRRMKLARQPMCESPGCIQAAWVVDHIISRRKRPDLAYTMSNLQSLCKRCHDQKTAREDGSFGNR